MGGAHKISVQKQVRTAAQGLVLIFAKVCLDKIAVSAYAEAAIFFVFDSKESIDGV